MPTRRPRVRAWARAWSASVVEVRAVGAGGDERVDALVRLGEGARRLERVLEGEVEDAHLGAAGEHGRRALDDLAEPARAERPDDRLAIAAERHARGLLRQAGGTAPALSACPGTGTSVPIKVPQYR